MSPAAAGPLALVVLLLAFERASAHGLMIHPRSRPWIAYAEQGYHNSHGVASGGARNVSNNGTFTWPRGQKGMCGDAYGKTRWDTPGSITATYREGQVITVDVVVAVNHLGRFNMWLCPLEAQVSKQCKKLNRADGKGRHWYLPFVANWTGGSYGGDLPLYGDGSYSYYKLPSIHSGNGCKIQRLCNDWKGMVTYRTSWKLPEGFACDHCKLQWQWLTAHSCWPPCPEENKDEPTCKNKQVYKTCGEPGTQFPEEFFNCADVRITDAARVDTASQKPQWASDISLVEGLWGKPKALHMNGRRLLR